ncbi:unnamed protein product [Closterium sp. NIES-53]
MEMPGEPETLKETLEISDAEEWTKAMESELKSIEENGTWELVELLEGRKSPVLEEEIFMVQPEGFDDGSGRVWKLKKALYGLKQAPRQWYLKLREVLEEIGFTLPHPPIIPCSCLARGSRGVSWWFMWMTSSFSHPPLTL